MADDQAVLDFLRVRFTRVDEALADLKADIGELKVSVGHWERSVADLHVQSAAHSIRMDRLSDRLQHIERRLDLVDMP